MLPAKSNENCISIAYMVFICYSTRLNLTPQTDIFRFLELLNYCDMAILKEFLKIEYNIDFSKNESYILEIDKGKINVCDI